MSEIGAALVRRTARAPRLPPSLRAEVVFDAGPAGSWTVRLASGQAAVRPGKAWRPDCTIRADAATMLAVVEGRTPGVEAFLGGRIFVRGNLALSLELDEFLPPVQRHPRSPRVTWVESEGVRTFCLDAGPRDRDAVILIHGLGATGTSFLPTLWDLSLDHRVVAIDLPGFGETDKPLRALRPAFFARHLVGVMDRLGIARAHLVGNSMGGRVALEVALRSPDRVGRLVLLAPSMAWKRFRFGVGIVRMIRHELAVVPILVLHPAVVRALRSMFAVPERVPAAAMDAAADEFLRVFATARGRISFFNAMREIYLEDAHGERGFWDRLPALRPPSLFVFGDRDWLVPPGFARFVAEAVPAARCEVLPTCGHVPQFELPERTHQLVRAFFAEDQPNR
jgi:pimeloyl-ACP methyl ester carboxylesterase